MDLIYADKNGVDLGVIGFYDFDLAYGRDENDFQLTLGLEDHCCDVGYMLHVDNTDYGGIIDAIQVDIKNDTVTYSGRTWHGILNSKVIENTETVSGDANDIMRSNLTECDLSDLFYVGDTLSDIYILNWQFGFLEPLYDGITRMLKENVAKLEIKYNGRLNKVELSAKSRIDYVNDDYFDSDELTFTAKKSDNVTNHAICILSNDTETKRIDLFTDENGTIQPYIKNESSLIDESRYYLDKSQQVIFGKDEIVKVFESGIEVSESYHPVTAYPNDWVSNFENYWHQEIDEDTGEIRYVQNEYIEKPYYIKLTSKPDDWETNYESFYIYNEINNEYINVTAVNDNNYVPINSEPENWAEEYASYFVKNGSKYENVGGVDDDSMYKVLGVGEKPKYWDTEYGNYFEKDFSTNTYVPVSSTETTREPRLLSARPLDWDNSLSRYYYKATKYKQINAGGQIVAIEDGSAWLTADKYYAKDGSGIKTYQTTPNYYQGKYYEMIEKPVPPMWIAGRYYTKTKDAIAPPWQTGTYYIEEQNPQPPTFIANRFYRQRIHTYAKSWINGKYFRKQNDHYITAIENAISELQTEWGTRDSLDIDLPELYNYDIGDVVGTTEHITQLEVAQFVTKKIVKIKNGVESISYEIGKEK